jgi:hypothetical protein
MTETDRFGAVGEAAERSALAGAGPSLSFPKTVTEPVWRDDEKDFVSRVSMLVDSIASLCFF